MATPLKRHQTLAWKFFLRTGLTILLLAGVLLAVTFQLAESGARKAAGSGLLGASQVLDRVFDQENRVLDAGLEVFTQYSANVTYIEEASTPQSVRDLLLDNLAKLRAELAVVVRPTGMLLSCTTDGAKQDYQNVEIVQMALAPDKAAQEGYPGPDYRGFLNIEMGQYGGLYQAVARTLRTPGGGLIGGMVVGKKLDDRAAAELRKIALPPGRKGDPPAHLAVLSHFRAVGSTLPPEERQALERLLTSDAQMAGAKERVLKGQRSEFVRLQLGDRPYLAVMNPLRGQDGPTLEMASLVLMPMDPFLAPFRTLERTILLAGAAGLVLALLLALRTARSVTAPLARLTEAAGALAEGERPELPPLGAQDEVGTLTRAFGALISELRAKEELLTALEQVRASAGGGMAAGLDPGQTRRDQVGVTVMDMDATVLVRPEGTSQALTGAPPAPVRKRLTLKEGELFGERYRIASILGKGGMGVVLKAHDLQLDEDVALKVIRPELEMDPGFLEQLKQEIKLARRITHRYVLRTHDFGEAEGIPFVSMEYLKGVTLKQLLDDRGSLPLPLVLRIGRQVSEGLEAAHAQGVVHRDIKPLNVLFDSRGDAKLMDFGLAAPVATSGVSKEGHVFGTPRYMAPEQARGERTDPRTDLYALGVMLFELSTGFPPYEHPNIAELLKMHLAAPVPDVRALAPDLPPAFGELVARLMAKDMNQRPASAADVVEALRNLARGEGAAA